MKSYEIQHYSIPVGIVTYVHLLFLNVFSDFNVSILNGLRSDHLNESVEPRGSGRVREDQAWAQTSPGQSTSSGRKTLACILTFRH